MNEDLKPEAANQERPPALAQATCSAAGDLCQPHEWQACGHHMRHWNGHYCERCLAPAACSADKPKTIDFDLYANLRHQFDQVQSENLKLRQIAARVPSKIYIKAKEKAGHGDAVKPNDKDETRGTQNL